MTRYIFVAALCLSTSAFAGLPAQLPADSILKAPETSLLSAKAKENTCVASSESTDSSKRSGCCSHHGGVCGCSGSMQQCCDGVQSPSCGCGE